MCSGPQRAVKASDLVPEAPLGSHTLYVQLLNAITTSLPWEETAGMTGR